MPRMACWIALMIFASGVQVTGHTCSARDTYRFTARPPQVGDRSEQQMRSLLDMKMTVSQAGQVVYTSDGNVEHTQSRKAEVLEVHDRRATKAKVTFETSEQVTSQKDRPPTTAKLPVAGKTYLAARVGRGAGHHRRAGQQTQRRRAGAGPAGHGSAGPAKPADAILRRPQRRGGPDRPSAQFGSQGTIRRSGTSWAKSRNWTCCFWARRRSRAPNVRCFTPRSKSVRRTPAAGRFRFRESS